MSIFGIETTTWVRGDVLSLEDSSAITMLRLQFLIFEITLYEGLVPRLEITSYAEWQCNTQSIR